MWLQAPPLSSGSRGGGGGEKTTAKANAKYILVCTIIVAPGICYCFLIAVFNFFLKRNGDPVGHVIAAATC